MAGKKVRCPKCQSIQQVPAAEPEPESEYGVKAEDDDFWSQTAGAASNPFESPAATPSHTRQGYSEREARSFVAIPGTVLYILALVAFTLSVVMLGIELLKWLAAPNDISAARRAGRIAGPLVLMSLTYATSQGANHLRNLREPGYVWFALIMSMSPCGTFLFCPVAIPFAIWGIVLMCDRRIAAYFRG
ncbi:hypothetical protein [Blastopirellula marina]|uniref:Uncharacterized protein n=1 Tax=Blastopirellula marina DSM 3645 TaxID=314230 RepID=A3ZRS3_9BACT|nr:hypothetical protein [Blastopirellula marina]EAQ80842.1 hypothetical protein DSM3645_12516 [Blastopirellula marina DSM 3645]